MYSIGIDVSKKTLHCLILLDPESGRQRTKALPNTAEGHAQVVRWGCKSGGCEASELQVTMEATGVYHEALAEALYEAGCRVCVVNPLLVKRFAQSLGTRTKNDLHDRLVLARFGQERELRAWTPAAPEIKQLKALQARLQAIDGDVQREKNRLEQAKESVAPDSVTNSIDSMIKVLEQEQKRLRKQIDQHIDRHPGLRQNRELLETIPGVGRATATHLLCLFQDKTFRDAREAAAFLGLVPVEHQSGDTVYQRPRLSKAGNARLRAALFFPAIVAKGCNPDVRALFQRLVDSGKSKMSAIGAAMRKLVHIAFGVIKNQTPYKSQIA